MELRQATRIVCDMMQADPDFRQVWEQGIIDAFNEELTIFRVKQKKSYVKQGDFNLIAKRAANAFLNNLIDTQKY